MPERVFDRGSIVREFRVNCGICSGSFRQEAPNIDKFAEDIMRNGWRLTKEHGWVHKTCCKMMPAQIKFK